MPLSPRTHSTVSIFTPVVDWLICWATMTNCSINFPQKLSNPLLEQEMFSSLGGSNQENMFSMLVAEQDLNCLIAARKVGEKGRVIGVDMAPEMIEKAR